MTSTDKTSVAEMKLPLKKRSFELRSTAWRLIGNIGLNLAHGGKPESPPGLVFLVWMSSLGHKS